MADKIVKKGSTNVSVEMYIVDSTDGTPELGVLFNTAGIDLNYRRDLAAVTTITEATLAALTTAHADGGFKEIANGRYRLDLPDAAFATGVSEVTIGGTVTGMIVYPVTVQLVDYDPEDSAALGLTAVPATVAGAVGSVTGAVGSVAGHTAQTADHTAGIAAIPTTAMRGTDSAALASGVVLASSEDVYHADIEYNYDSPVDEYTVRWYKNAARVTSGVTVPKVQVIKRSDGTDLVAAVAMTQIGTTGAYKYDESTNVILADEKYEIVVTATIDAGARDWGCHAYKGS